MILHVNSKISEYVETKDCVAVIGNTKVCVQHIKEEAKKKEA